MISAYVDASGQHDTPLLCVAAWVSNDFHWGAFKLSWQPHLEGVGRRYHSSDPHSSRVKPVLASLISRYAMAGAAITLDKTLYDSSASNDFKSRHGNAYSAALQGLIYTLGDWSNHYGFGPLNYFVEAGDDGQAHAKEWFGRVMSNKLARAYVNISSFSLVTKDALPAHASDLFAYEVTRQFPERGGYLTDWSKQIRYFHVLDMGSEGQAIPEMCAAIEGSDRRRANMLKRRKWLERKGRRKNESPSR